MNEATEPNLALTLDQCATQLQVSADTIVRWIRAGHLKAFVRPGATPGQKTGKKSYRIWSRDWETFCRRCTQTGSIQPEAPKVAVGARPAGTDGISRRKKRRSTA